MDERVRFGSATDAVATYHIPLVYEIAQAPVSLERLRLALCTVITKHKVLRTRLLFDENTGVLRQEVLDQVTLEIILTQGETDEHVRKILYDEETNPRLFELNKGRVFRCHAIRRSSTIHIDLLQSSDILVFNFHHVAFDGGSIDLFFQDLKEAYSTDQPLSPCVFHYIDYATHETKMNVDETRAFWKQHFDGFSNYYLPLPYDHSQIDKITASGRGSTVTMQLSTDLVEHLFLLIKEHETTLFQLGLAAFYTFLFKLTQQDDLCVLTVTANRTRAELVNLIGVFVNTIPHRLAIKPHSTFASLMQRVKDLALAILPHSHLPFQQISTNANVASLQTLFDVETIQDDVVYLDSETLLRPFMGTTTDPHSVAKFDLTCTLHYNVRTKSLTVALNASSDLFETTTVQLLARRFECLLGQLLTHSAYVPIYEFSLLLPYERQLLHQLDSRDQLLLPSNLLLIHEQFACRAIDYSQKLAVILDDQSLTYAELLHSSQLVAHHLIDQSQVQSGDIIGQCVERSIEMSIGIMGILFSGASYLPLSPHESAERLQILIDLTRPQCVLTHSGTNHLIEKISVPIDTMFLPSNIASFSETLVHVNVSMDAIAFLIFTSGSTGIPKVVPISHLGFTQMVQSYSQLKFHDADYITIQMASCSFDEHANEYMGSFICGSTIVLLRPHGNLDTRYLCETIAKNQATRIDFVPTSVAILTDYLNKKMKFANNNYLATVKLITVGGKYQ